MTEAGVSRDANERVMAATTIMGAMMEFDVPLDRLYLDPLLLPVGVAQQQAMEAIESIAMFKQLNDPPLKTVVGLSNIYNGCPEHVKSPLAAAFLSLLIPAASTRRSWIRTTSCRWRSCGRTRQPSRQTTRSRSRWRCSAMRHCTATHIWTEHSPVRARWDGDLMEDCTCADRPEGARPERALDAVLERHAERSRRAHRRPAGDAGALRLPAGRGAA